MPRPVLYAYAACSERTTAWLRRGLPLSLPEPSRASVSTTWASVSEVRCESSLARAAAEVAPSAPWRAVERPMPLSASRPTAERAGSAAPRRSVSERVTAAPSSAQVYVREGQPRDLAAGATSASATGDAAMWPAVATGTPSPPSLARSTHRAESGIHTAKSGSRPAPSASATLYDSRAVTRMSMQEPSEVTLSARARSATDRTAGATSGEATRSSRTAESRHESPKESSPLPAATAAPPATTSTSRVATTTVRRRPAAGRPRGPSVAYASGKL